MEDVYTIKVKSKPQNANTYPSEKRYSASTVLGLAWINFAVAIISLFFSILAFMNPIGRGQLNHIDSNAVDAYKWNDTSDLNTTLNVFTDKSDPYVTGDISYFRWILIAAPSFLMLTALGSGCASMFASIRWYIDKNITWLFCMSIISAVVAFISMILTAVWLGYSSQLPLLLTDLESLPSIKNGLVRFENSTYYIIRIPLDIYNRSQIISKNDILHIMGKRSLAFNIFIAALLELLWSLLSMKIAWKGMNNSYDDNTQREEPPGNCIQVVTTVKGNNTRNSNPNFRIIPPKPDLLHHFPSNKVPKIYLSKDMNSFYMKHSIDERPKMAPDETSEQYRERMLDFLNKCDSFDGSTLPDSHSCNSDIQLRTIPELSDTVSEVPDVVEVNQNLNEGRISSLSWGDLHELPVYNPDTLDLDKIIKEKLNKCENECEPSSIAKESAA